MLRMLKSPVHPADSSGLSLDKGAWLMAESQQQSQVITRPDGHRRLHIIVNPTSGNGSTRRAWPTIEQRLKRLGYEVDFRMTESSGDGARLGREAIAAGVVVVGGDGTLNEVVNGLFQASHGSAPDVVLSVLPTGTGRDFARNIGLRSFENALETLGNGEIRAIDVGRVDYSNDEGTQSRYFVNAGDVGIGAETAALINRSSKILGGKISYFLGAARTVFKFEGRHAEVYVDGELVHDDRLALVCMANGRYLAGGMLMAPEASMDDGLFDILILQDVPKYSLLGSLLPSVYLGRHINHPAVSFFRGSEIRVKAPVPLLFEVDGEQPGTTDIRATILPGTLRIRFPERREKVPEAAGQR
jgi:diacylglycerol kinase (ATP)